MGWLIAAVVVIVVVVVAYLVYKALTSDDQTDPLGGACDDADGGSNDPVDGGKPKPCTPAAKKKIDSVTLISLTFLSDHALLKDYVTDWDDGGTKYAEPEWTPANSYPVSHTMDTVVKVKLKLRVGPSDAASERATLRGEAPNGMIFEKEIDLSPGDQEVELVSDSKLEKKIQRLDFAFDWKLIGPAAPLVPDKTANEMFVTMGTPTTPARRPGITYKRMKHAVKETSSAASLDPHKIVEHVMSRWSSFNLSVVYDNAWELADDTAGVGADCQTIVRYTENVIKMVGCPGTTAFIVVWAKVPAPTVGIENPAYTPNVSDPKQWYDSFNVPDPAKADWRATLVDHGGGQNRYEACLKFTHGGVTGYYAGGVGKLTNVNQVIKVFKTMSWRVDSTGELKDVIHAY